MNDATQPPGPAERRRRKYSALEKAMRQLHCERLQLEENPAQPAFEPAFEHIGAVIAEFFRRIDEAPDGSSAKINAMWESLAGPETAAHTAPGPIRGDALMVFADSSPWLDCLYREKKNEILERLRNALGDAAPKRLAVKIAPAAVAAWQARENDTPQCPDIS